MTALRPDQDDAPHRGRNGWLCPQPCARAVVIAVQHFVDRYSRDEQAEVICAAPECSTCSGHPATFSMPSYGKSPS